MECVGPYSVYEVAMPGITARPCQLKTRYTMRCVMQASALLRRNTSQTVDWVMDCVGPYQYTNLPHREYARCHANQRRAKLCDV